MKVMLCFLSILYRSSYFFLCYQLQFSQAVIDQIFLQAKRGSVLRGNCWCLHSQPLCSKLAKFSCPLFVTISYFVCHVFFLLFDFMWQMKYTERVLGLILVSPICRAPSWTEWLYNKVLISMTSSTLLALLHFT